MSESHVNKNFCQKIFPYLRMFILWGVHGEHFLYFSLCHIGQIDVKLIIIVTIILILVLLILILININIAKKN